jgi:hypothetical protein
MAGTDTTTGLEQMICFELHAASRAMTGLYRPALDALGLTYPQYIALRVIWHRGRLTVRDLGTALHLDSGTLSPLLKRLEHQGLIQRARGTDDEQQAADIPERLACALDLTIEEFTHLHHLLSRIRDTAAATSTI